MTRMPVEDRRKALVEAAFEVIAEHGVENATTRSICSHAGMPLASFHYAFESRDDLLRRVMLTILPVAIDDWVASMLPRADSPLHGRAGLEKNLRKHLGMLRMVLESGPGRMRACVSLALYAHNHPPVAAAAKEMFESLYTIADQGLVQAAHNMPTTWVSTGCIRQISSPSASWVRPPPPPWSTWPPATRKSSTTSSTARSRC